jgi:hypothetical protein
MLTSLRRLYHLLMGHFSGNLLVHCKGDLYRRLYRGTDSTNTRAGTPITVYISIKLLTVHIREDSEMYSNTLWPDGIYRARFYPCTLWQITPS